MHNLRKLTNSLACRLSWWRAQYTNEVWRITDSSTVFQWLSYNPRRRTLTAQFMSGARYRYDVPPTVARSIFASRSPGKVFNQRIKGSYPAWRLV
jgi:hypothetical protein